MFHVNLRFDELHVGGGVHALVGKALLVLLSLLDLEVQLLLFLAPRIDLSKHGLVRFRSLHIEFAGILCPILTGLTEASLRVGQAIGASLHYRDAFLDFGLFG